MKDEYEPLKVKFDLPDYDMMDREFEISSIEPDSFPLRRVREKILDKIDSSIKFFDGLFHPDADFSSFTEANIFSDKDREDMLKIYKTLMIHRRNISILFFEDSSESNAEFIINFVKDWERVKPMIITFVKRLKDCWEHDVSKKEVVGYLG